MTKQKLCLNVWDQYECPNYHGDKEAGFSLSDYRRFTLSLCLVDPKTKLSEGSVARATRHVQIAVSIYANHVTTEVVCSDVFRANLFDMNIIMKTMKALDKRTPSKYSVYTETDFVFALLDIMKAYGIDAAYNYTDFVKMTEACIKIGKYHWAKYLQTKELTNAL